MMELAFKAMPHLFYILVFKLMIDLAFSGFYRMSQKLLLFTGTVMTANMLYCKNM